MGRCPTWERTIRVLVRADRLKALVFRPRLAGVGCGFRQFHRFDTNQVSVCEQRFHRSGHTGSLPSKFAKPLFDVLHHGFIFRLLVVRQRANIGR
jgi:hypothetical protein